MSIRKTPPQRMRKAGTGGQNGLRFRHCSVCFSISAPASLPVAGSVAP
jgi:hypothetical protein